MQHSTDSLELKVDLRLEGLVVVESGGTKQPRAHQVVVQVRLERLEALDKLGSTLDEGSVDDLDVGDLGGRESTLLLRDLSSSGGAGNSQTGNETRELHFEERMTCYNRRENVLMRLELNE